MAPLSQRVLAQQGQTYKSKKKSLPHKKTVSPLVFLCSLLSTRGPLQGWGIEASNPDRGYQRLMEVMSVAFFSPSFLALTSVETTRAHGKTSRAVRSGAVLRGRGCLSPGGGQKTMGRTTEETAGPEASETALIKQARKAGQAG